MNFVWGIKLCQWGVDNRMSKARFPRKHRREAFGIAICFNGLGVLYCISLAPQPLNFASQLASVSISTGWLASCQLIAI